MLLSTVAMDATVAQQRDFEIFEKIRKIFLYIFFRKSKIGFHAFMRTIINLFVKNFQPDPSKTVWLVCNYIATTHVAYWLVGSFVCLSVCLSVCSHRTKVFFSATAYQIETNFSPLVRRLM